MSKLILDNKEVVKGEWLDHPFEHGCVMQIDYINKEVHLYDGKEGWTLSERTNSLDTLKFVADSVVS